MNLGRFHNITLRISPPFDFFPLKYIYPKSSVFFLEGAFPPNVIYKYTRKKMLPSLKLIANTRETPLYILLSYYIYKFLFGAGNKNLLFSGVNKLAALRECITLYPGQFNIAPKGYLPKRKPVFQTSIFRGYVNLRGCML